MKFKLMCSTENNEKLNSALTQVGFTTGNDGEYIITENKLIKDFITAKRQESIHMIHLKEIQYFESYGSVVSLIRNKDNEAYVVNNKLFELESQLADKGFLRVNKSQIVNIRLIDEILPWFGQKFVLKLKSGVDIDVNRSYYKSFREYFGL